MTRPIIHRGNWGGERIEIFYSHTPQFTPYYTTKYDNNHVKASVSRRCNYQIEYMSSLTLPVTPTMYMEVAA